MRLTVSIVNFRTPALVNECVASIKRHAPTLAELDIAVVENGSGDDSLSLIREAHPDIRLIDSGDNLGFAGGNNLVLRNCDSDFVMLLNSDALVEAGSFDRLIEVLQANPRVGAVGARIVNASDGADQDYPFRFPSLRGMALRALHGAEHPAAGRGLPVALERLHGAGMMMRSVLLRSVGLLDDGFFMYDEDVDWCTRARALGWDLWLVPAARVLHHGGASSGRAPSGQRTSVEATERALRMRYELRRSRYRLYRKHRGALELLTLKLLTDSVLALQCVRAAGQWLVSPSRRRHATALLRANVRIIGINPFSIERAPHGT
jgi:N-acetylglucosaminyl-diphospho-decaprenol L-rhamnosyltransferase